MLCYNLGRWEFERSIRHCMEFKMTWNKSARSSPFLDSVVILGYFFFWAGGGGGGEFEVFVVA